MRVLVATITHRADDARIFAREIPAMLDAGIDLTVVAPFRASGIAPDPRIRAIDVPRTRGVRRLRPLIAAIRAIRREQSDLILVHDPELAFALAGSTLRSRVVWDVHEDLPAALRSKSYLPTPIRPILAAIAAKLERRVEGVLAGLLLAENGYAHRFRQAHPIILNVPRVGQVPPAMATQRRVIYVGSITKARGLDAMLSIAQQLEPDGISLLLVGEVPDAADRDRVRTAPNTTWTGPLPNDHALELVQESLAGLSLLSDLPNYRHSMPTKVLEYMSRGVPVVTTPLPVAVAALEGNGIVVPFDSDQAIAEAVAAIRSLASDDARRKAMRAAAFERVRTHYNWERAQEEFLAALRAFMHQDL